MYNTRFKVVRFLGCFIFLVALLVLVGWWLDIVPLMSVAPNMSAMNPATAALFMLTATWLFIYNSIAERNVYRLILTVIAVIVGLVAVIKLADYAGFIQVDIDQLLFSVKLRTYTPHNAMAPTTAVLFLLVSIVLLNPDKKTKAGKIAVDALLFCAFLIAYLGIIGYIYSLEPFYRIGPFIPMALNTAICFIAATIAVFICYPKGNLYKIFFSRFFGGNLIRRAVPLVLLVPPVFGYFRLLLQRANIYNTEYSVALDTAVLVMLVLLLVFYYANIVSLNDRERKKAEGIVLQSEEKYRSLVYNMKEGVLYYGTDQKIIFYNHGFCEMFGYREDELIGKNVIASLIPEENRARSGQRMNDRLQGIQEDYETEMLHKDGTKIMMNITARPILRNGAPVSFLSTFIDITERKKREEDLEAFSSSAAHDLNAPLARIDMLASYILEVSKSHLNEEDVEFLEIMQKTTADMRTLLKDLLLFAKVGAEKISKQHIDMNEMVAAIIKEATPNTANIRVDDMPVAYGDPGPIKQVWTNLINNAIKYSSKKEVPTISIGTSMVNKKLAYYVKDNGAGFNMSEATKLFTPFKRLHSDFEGNGLGLPIVKRIIEKHSGKIWAESERGNGATFYFTM
jgi:PAS domain S-box-containing protein